MNEYENRDKTAFQNNTFCTRFCFCSANLSSTNTLTINTQSVVPPFPPHLAELNNLRCNTSCLYSLLLTNEGFLCFAEGTEEHGVMVL